MVGRAVVPQKEGRRAREARAPTGARGMYGGRAAAGRVVERGRAGGGGHGGYEARSRQRDRGVGRGAQSGAAQSGAARRHQSVAWRGPALCVRRSAAGRAARTHGIVDAELHGAGDGALDVRVDVEAEVVEAQRGRCRAARCRLRSRRRGRCQPHGRRAGRRGERHRSHQERRDGRNAPRRKVHGRVPSRRATGVCDAWTYTCSCYRSSHCCLSLCRAGRRRPHIHHGVQRRRWLCGSNGASVAARVRERARAGNARAAGLGRPTTHGRPRQRRR